MRFDTKKLFCLTFCTYDGNFDTEIHDTTTHIIVKPDADLQVSKPAFFM